MQLHVCSFPCSRHLSNVVPHGGGQGKPFFPLALVSNSHLHHFPPLSYHWLASHSKKKMHTYLKLTQNYHNISTRSSHTIVVTMRVLGNEMMEITLYKGVMTTNLRSLCPFFPLLLKCLCIGPSQPKGDWQHSRNNGMLLW